MSENIFLKIGTINCAGITKTNYTRLYQLLEVVKDLDIVCMQETHFLKESDAFFFVNVFKKLFDIRLSTGSEKRTGVVILLNRNMLISKQRKIFEIDGRAYTMILNYGEKKIMITNIYAPAQDCPRAAFFEKLYDNFTENFRYYDEAIVCGDFNFVENIVTDRNSGVKQADIGVKQFTLIKNKLNIDDTFRKKNPQQIEFTHYSSRHKTQSRIDRIYTTTIIGDACKEFKFRYLPFTDHKLVTVKISINFLKLKHGPSYWKINNELLNESEKSIKKKMDEIVKNSLQQLHDDSRCLVQKWDDFKNKLKGKIKQVSQNLSHRYQKQIRSLEDKISDLKQLLKEIPNDNTITKQLNQANKELDKLLSKKIKEKLIKTHYQDLAHERYTIATAKMMQKKSAENRFIAAIKNENGQLTENQHEILREIRKQFEKQFQSKKCDEAASSEFLYEPPNTMVSQVNTDKMNKKITENEVLQAILSFKNGKCPGEDGLSIDFYKIYKESIVPMLTQLYNEGAEKNKLPDSFYFGIISLLYKGKGDKTERSSWRPLTMINNDYKILAKVLVNRMRETMKELISPDQNCAVGGRDIRDGLLSLCNTIYYAEQEELEECILLSIDHMSAFDIIEWKYMHDTLEHFGFPKVFRDWIQLLYKPNALQASVQVNGFVSSPFKVERGIRQGCPLSPLLYVLVTETIANYIRKCEQIKGITIFDNEKKINCYADDTNFTINNYKSVKEIFKIYDLFKQASGATLNTSKTKILLFGASHPWKTPKQYRNYLVDEIKIYGLVFDRHGPHLTKNTVKAIELIEKLKTKHLNKEISYFARAKIVETYFLSSLWYGGLFSKVTSEIIKLIENIIDKFIWYPVQINLVSRNKLKLTVESGGINYPDIKSKIDALLIMLLLRQIKLSNEEFFHFYNKTKNKSKKKLAQSDIPSLYKNIRLAVINSKIFIDKERKTVEVDSIQYETQKVTTKLLYNSIINHKLKASKVAVEKYWNERLPPDTQADFQVRLKLSVTPYISGYTRNIHFAIIHRFLYTRSKQAYTNKNTIPFCKHCQTQNIELREDVMHVIVHCERVSNFWLKIEKLLNKNESSVKLSVVDKVFGLLITQNKNEENVNNIIIQTAQRAIWQSRNAFEGKNVLINIWDLFKRFLFIILSKINDLLPRKVIIAKFMNTGHFKFTDKGIRLTLTE